MNIQRLRNLTTGKIHTDICHVYDDLGEITGQRGLMTHMLPGARKACLPWLKRHASDPRLWDGTYDPTHTGEIELPTPSAEDRAEMFELYKAQPNPLEGKQVVVVNV